MRSNVSTTPASRGASPPPRGALRRASPRRPGAVWRDPTRRRGSRFDAELDNLRAAVAWALDAQAQADAELGLRIVAPLVGQSFYRPSAGVGEWAETASARRRNLDIRPALRSAYRRGVESGSRRRPPTSLARVRPRRCATGSPPTRPRPDGPTARSASADSFAGDHAAARQTLVAGRRALDAIGAPDYAHLELDLNGLMGRSVAGQLEEARVPAEEALARARTLANPSQLIVALRWFAGTRSIGRVGRNDPGARRMPGPQPRRRHSRRTRRAATARVARPAPRSFPPTCPSHRGVTRRGRPRRRHGTISHVGLRAPLRCQRRRRSRRSGARGDARRCRHRRPLAGLTYLADVVLADRQGLLDHVRAQLGPDRYDAAYATGAAMSDRELIASTLAELELMAEAADG